VIALLGAFPVVQFLTQGQGCSCPGAIEPALTFGLFCHFLMLILNLERSV